LPDREIDKLRARQDGDGYIALPKPPPNFICGQRVRIQDGPFEGLNAIFAGMASEERVRVLLAMLGGQVAVTLSERAIAAA
jgi:transcription antitermination factor NusG